jgi:hypothetical protein
MFLLFSHYIPLLREDLVFVFFFIEKAAPTRRLLDGALVLSSRFYQMRSQILLDIFGAVCSDRFTDKDDLNIAQLCNVLWDHKQAYDPKDLMLFNLPISIIFYFGKKKLPINFLTIWNISKHSSKSLCSCRV